MSKATLKKELAMMDNDQLRQVILEAYDVSKDFAAYFEYFLNPDPETLLEKVMKALRKEILRFKYRTCKARVSVIHKELKKFMAFQPGHDYVAKLMINIVGIFAGIDAAGYDYTRTQLNGLEKIIGEYFKLGEKTGELEHFVKQYEEFVSSVSNRRYFQAFLVRAANCSLEEIATASGAAIFRK